MGAFLCRAAFKEPTVRLKFIRPKSVSKLGSTLIVRFSVHNPNSYGLGVKSLTYKIVKSSDRVKFAEGKLSDPFTVPPNSSVDARAEVTLSFAGLGAVGKSLLRRGKTSYRASGTLTMGMGKKSRRMMVPFASEGEFALFDAEAVPSLPFSKSGGK